MTNLPRLVLCVLLWAQTLPIPSPIPPAPEPTYWLPSDSPRIAKVKPQVVGKCPIHGELRNGEVMIISNNQRTNEDLKVCLLCLSDLLKRNLPKVEDPEP